MVRSLGFLGVRTPAFDQSVARHGDVLGLVPIEFLGDRQRDGEAAWNHVRGPGGRVYEIIGRVGASA